MDRKKLIIGGVIIAVAIGGYLYWSNSQKNKKKKLTDSPEIRKKIMKKLNPKLLSLREKIASGQIPTQQ